MLTNNDGSGAFLVGQVTDFCPDPLHEWENQQHGISELFPYVLREGKT
jgi:hypothetical protein